MVSYRKSLKAGPFRINLSKSGVGVSTGVKGLRVGVNGKGKSYVSAGSKGVRYRKQLDKSSGCAGIALLILVALSIFIV